MSQTETESPSGDPLEELEQVEAQAQAEREEAQTPAEQAAPQPQGEQPAEEQRPEWQQQFETPEEMWERLRNVDTLRGNLANTVGEERARAERAEQALAALTGQGQPQAQQAQPQGIPGMEGIPQLSKDELDEWYDEDPVAAMQYISYLSAAQVAAAQQQQLAPVFESVNEASASQALEALKGEFGDEMLSNNREALAARIAADKEYFVDPGTRQARLREALMASEFERTRNGRTQQAQTQTRAPNGTFAAGDGERTAYVEGGSTPAPPAGRQPDVDPIIAEMDRVEVRGDTFGGLPRIGPA